MAANVEQLPFVKQLAAGDRPTREKALTSLQAYLCSGRTFTPLELLKIWKGLFYCMHHTDRPAPQAALARSLSSLLLALPATVFLPYLAAFWDIMIEYYSDIPSLRLDKYLYLIRLYVSSSFLYLSQHEWDDELTQGWIALLKGDYEWPVNGCGVLNTEDWKVPDGLRYHVLDVWVDGLVECDDWEDKGLLGPVERVAKEGKTRVLKQRARGVLADERLGTNEGTDGKDDEDGEEEGEFEGFEE